MIRAVSDKYFKVRHSLLIWQQQEHCKAAKEAISRHAAEWNKRIADGRPAFDEVLFPLALAADALVKVISEMEDRAMLLEEAASLIEDYLQSKNSEVTRSCQELDDTRLRMYIHLVCQTIMSIMAEPILSDEVAKSWRKNICPACGSAPTLAYCDDSDKRKLICGACATQWQIKQIGCAMCGDEDHTNLRTLPSDGECPGWTVHVCKSCRRYLKVADLQEFTQAPDWVLANLTTLPMDFAAEKWLKENFS